MKSQPAPFAAGGPVDNLDRTRADVLQCYNPRADFACGVSPARLIHTQELGAIVATAKRGLRHGQAKHAGAANQEHPSISIGRRLPSHIKGDEPNFSDLRDALIAVYGTDFGVRNPNWLSRFTVNHFTGKDQSRAARCVYRAQGLLEMR